MNKLFQKECDKINNIKQAHLSIPFIIIASTVLAMSWTCSMVIYWNQIFLAICQSWKMIWNRQLKIKVWETLFFKEHCDETKSLFICYPSIGNFLVLALLISACAASHDFFLLHWVLFRCCSPNVEKYFFAKILQNSWFCAMLVCYFCMCNFLVAMRSSIDFESFAEHARRAWNNSKFKNTKNNWNKELMSQLINAFLLLHSKVQCMC